MRRPQLFPICSDDLVEWTGREIDYLCLVHNAPAIINPIYEAEGARHLGCLECMGFTLVGISTERFRFAPVREGAGWKEVQDFLCWGCKMPVLEGIRDGLLDHACIRCQYREQPAPIHQPSNESRSYLFYELHEGIRPVPNGRPRTRTLQSI